MKAPNITPGPWKWTGTKGRPEGLHYLSGAERATVGAALDNSFTNSPANARLIAAAPQLAEALHDAFQYLIEVASDERKFIAAHFARQAKTALLAAGYTE